jgi:GT2 family glycosyltransferase
VPAAISHPTVDAPTVSVIIVTARRPERLVRCLEAVAREAPPGLPYEVVIVLNAAAPGVRERLDDAVEGARIVSSEIPLGLAGGANLGAAHARGRLLHVLHDDTEVGPDWLTPLTTLLDRRPEVGAVGSLVLNLDGSVQTAGHVIWRDGSTSPRWSGTPPTPDGLGQAYPVDYCASASIVVRRDAWDAVGGLDEGFHPAYYVDVDLSMSLRARGYVVMCEPASRVHHERGGSSGAAFREFLSARHRERFVAKWADDLVHQEPMGQDANALARARRATARRATAVAMSSRHPPASASPIEAEDELTRLRRERALLQRDVAVKQAFMVHVEELLSDAAAVRERLEMEGAKAQRALAELHESAAEVHRSYAELAHDYQRMSAESDALGERLAATDVELQALRACAQTLAAIESGGWWRLRTRLLPLMRLAEPLRDVVRRHRG